MKTLLSLILFLPLSLFSQFVDSFADSNYYANPKWSGDTNKFEVNSILELHLNAPSTSDASILHTKSNSISNASWEFDIQLDFNPSSSNYAQIYLVSNLSNFKSNLSGYYVKLGDSEDEVSLYFQNKDIHQKIIDGQDKQLNASNNEARVKVLRDSIGNWELFVDLGSGYISEGNVFHDSLNYSKFFGVFCKYTSTRSDKFYFDNFIVSGDPYDDTIPPLIVHQEITSSDQLFIEFNEKMDSIELANPLNYQLGDDSLNPIVIEFDTGFTKVELTFNPDFPINTPFDLKIQNLKDTSYNQMITNVLTFEYLVFDSAYFGDLLINEIMFDPDPPHLLPNAEYLEIRNNSSKRIKMDTWYLADRTDTTPIPTTILDTNSFLIVCDTIHKVLFEEFGSVTGMKSMPNFNNSGDKLLILNKEMAVIDSVSYQSNWFDDKLKSEGGWSIERTAPNSECTAEYSWQYSDTPEGGTPGKRNFIDTASHESLLNIVEIYYHLDNSIHLLFNSPIDTSRISGNIEILIKDEDLNYNLHFHSIYELNTLLHNSLTPGKHSLSLKGIVSCRGLELTQNEYEIIVPSFTLNNGLILNEILFNPIGDGTDFVELYNNSAHFQDLSYWSLLSFDEEMDTVKSKNNITGNHEFLGPRSLVVISEDSNNIKMLYPYFGNRRFINSKLPTMNNDDGSIGLAFMDQFVERVDYNEKMHFKLIKDVDGVSLERMNRELLSSDPSNWHSAAESAGFATPGYVNSHSYELGARRSNFTLKKELICPNNNGKDDLLLIEYNLSKSGYVADINIYDRFGNRILEFANNLQLARKGILTWDGLNENGNKASIGIHFIHIRAYHSSGKTIIERLPFVVVQKM